MYGHNPMLTVTVASCRDWWKLLTAFVSFGLKPSSVVTLRSSQSQWSCYPHGLLLLVTISKFSDVAFVKTVTKMLIVQFLIAN
jgi:hypothetical protein